MIEKLFTWVLFGMGIVFSLLDLVWVFGGTVVHLGPILMLVLFLVYRQRCACSESSSNSEPGVGP